MGFLKSFVATTTAGLVAKLLSVAVDNLVSALSPISPLIGLAATLVAIIFIAKDIVDIYEAGVVGVAAILAFLFQFMPLLWVVGIYTAVVITVPIISPFIEWLIELVKNWL
jgi:hypothetical protein